MGHVGLAVVVSRSVKELKYTSRDYHTITRHVSQAVVVAEGESGGKLPPKKCV
jgi:hypothetical protein